MGDDPILRYVDTFTRLLQHAPYAVFICNTRGEMVYYNDSARAMYGKLDQYPTPDKLAAHVDLRNDGKRVKRGAEFPLFRALRGAVVSEERFSVSIGEGTQPFAICVSAHPIMDGENVIGAFSIHRRV